MTLELMRFQSGSLVRIAALCVALASTLAGTSALAQTPPDAPAAVAPPPAAAPVQEVVVTGSRITDTDAASANPISLVTAKDLTQSAATSLEKYFRKTPAVDFTGGASAADADVGGGANFVGVRGLGPQRTLVLVNGQRYPLTDLGTTGNSYDAVDLNNIPVPMIQRIDILRDGASSLYGADAIGGVINIITLRHFNGVEIGGSVGETSYGDDLKFNVYSVMGSDFDKGNILIEVGTDHEDGGVPEQDRFHSADPHAYAGITSFEQRNPALPGANAVINGVGWYFPNGLNSGILASNAYTLGTHALGDGCFSGGRLPQDVFACSPNSSSGAAGAAWWGLILPKGTAPCSATNFDDCAFPVNDLFTGLDRRTINFTADYQLTPDISATVEGFYVNRTATQTLGVSSNPSIGAFSNGVFSAAYIPGAPGCNIYNPTCSNDPATQAALDAKYGIVASQCPTGMTSCAIDVPLQTIRPEVGPLTYNFGLDSYRMRAALDGTLFNDYTWEVGYFYGQSSANTRVANSIDMYHMSQELGMNPCGTEVGCSLANFFGAYSLTPEQAAYLRYTASDTSQYTMSEAYGNIGGPIWDLPAGTIKGVVGFEYRTDSLYDNPDPVIAAGDSGFLYSTPTQGAYATASGYIEVNAPLLKDLPLVKLLTVDASGRYDYNTHFGKALTNKVGLDWAVTDDFRFRGSHSTGFRAPQVKELFGGHGLATPGGDDPCAPGGADAGNAACEAAITAAGGNDSTVKSFGQILAITGGNPTLKPETSQEWTMGGVFTPSFVPGLSMTVDYYTVLIRDEIAALDPLAILSLCYGGVPYVISQQQACAYSGPRQQGTGSLAPIQALNGNVYDETTNGIDMHVSYSLPTETIGLPAWGSLGFNGDATYLLSDDISAAGSVLQRAGTFNDPSGRPRWKALANLTFTQDDWSFGWTTRYYGGVRNLDSTSPCEYGTVTCPASGIYDFSGNEAAGIFYHDISVTYNYKNVTLTAGVDNLFNKDPPYLAFVGGYNNTIADGGYDVVGRFIYLKASVKF